MQPDHIFARVQAPGFHTWPGATPTRDYLALRHRHIFKVCARVNVRHDERDIEFHDLQSWLRQGMNSQASELTDDNLLDFGGKSCETIARGIAAHLSLHLPTDHVRDLEVEVSEDGECGAVVHVMLPADRQEGGLKHV